MTYDNSPEIIELSEKFGFEHKAIPMKNTHHALMNELLVGSNLKWAEEE